MGTRDTQKGFEAELAKKYPLIPWREPIPVQIANETHHFSCRLCIATVGLSRKQKKALLKTRQQFDQHMKEAHPQ